MTDATFSFSSKINPHDVIRNAVMDAADLNFANAISRNEFIAKRLSANGFNVSAENVPFAAQSYGFKVTGQIVHL